MKFTDEEVKAVEALECQLLNSIAKLSPKVRGVYTSRYMELIKSCLTIIEEKDEKD
jgi:hypothetical protein